ncbi:sigma-70 family RNA polymerase sigma factor [Aeromicrobium sp. NPDC092404]|uniref:sigma-70 family RNA polymerase sigma factor n=1 Tax=Aeromicrobium sp. NPDC092404 TaxID=3154976 RepID=UPI0034494CAA
MTARPSDDGDRPDLSELGDADLVDLARSGVDDAYAALYDRHSFAAHRLARHLGMHEEADDVVSESFAQVLELLQRGKGPLTSFRAYLFTTIRHDSARRSKARRRLVPSSDDAAVDSLIGPRAGQLDGFETAAVRAAYMSLPERWRTVLWQIEVERRKPQELADALDLSPNGVSALAYRARAALREAYLKQHLASDTAQPSRSCREARADLPALVRRTLRGHREVQVRAHLGVCRACVAIRVELEDVNAAVGGAARLA